MASVTFTGVDKRYGEVPVIEGLSLEVKDREFMVLVGPSGSGKSTALRMVAGLEEISGGTIAIGGKRVNDVPPRDRDIAMVFQNYALYPHMSVRENLDFGLRLRKTPAPEIERLVGETAKLLGITGLLDRKPKQLSGGERQRVALGRAIMRKPAVFLFDEPLSNLDAKLRVQMRAEIKKLQNTLQTTAIYVTHDQTEAMTMGSRIAVMKDGRLQQVGTPIEVYRRPKNVFVAGFIGNLPMNLLAATLEDRGRRVAAAGFSLESREPFAAAGEDGRRVVVGLRPEDLRGPAPPGAAAKIAIQAEVCEPIGNEVVVHGRAGSDALVCVHGADRVPEPGDRIDVAVDLGRVHLFDAGSGERLASGAEKP